MPGAVAALVLTLPAWVPILAPTTFLLTGDALGHVVRAWHLQQAISAGDWFPRWMPQLYGGYGYPTLNFYAPLTSYLLVAIAAVIRPAGLYGAAQLVASASSLAIIGGSYALGWRLWRHGPAALLAAGAVAFAPYLLQANLFIRGGIPELVGLAAVPWMLVAAHALWGAACGAKPAGRTVPWGWALTGLTTAVLLSHSVTALFAGILIVGWSACLWLWRPSRRALFSALGACAFGAALSAFMWLPALLQVPLVQMERVQRGMTHYRNWFITWPGYHAEAWGLPARSPFTVGFPIDLHLAYPTSLNGPPRLSLWQGMFILGAALALAATWHRWRRGARHELACATSGGRPPHHVLVAATSAFGVAFAIVAYAMSFDWFLPLWERYAAVRIIQYPNRLFGPIGFAVAIAAGGALALWLRPRLAAWLASAIVVILLAMSTALGRSVPLNTRSTHVVDAAFAIGHEHEHPGATTTLDEYLPRTAIYDSFHAGEWRDFSIYERLFPEVSWLGGRVAAWSGDVAFRALDAGGLWTSADVAVGGSSDAVIAFHQLGFVGWRAWVDGRPAPVSAAPHVEALAISPGFLLVSVPPGEHRVSIRFGADSLHLAAAALSGIAWLAVAAWCLWRGTRPRRVSGERTTPTRAVWSAAGATVAAVVLLCGVRLLSQLRPPTPGAGAPVVVASLADAVRGGSARIASPTGSALGPDRFVDIRFLSVTAHDLPVNALGPRARRLLFAHPPTQIDVELDLPGGAYFQTGIGMDPATWDAPLGDGVRFVATITPVGRSGSQAETVLLDHFLNPRAKGEQRRWIDVLADLRPWAGERVRLTLRTDPRGDPLNDWAGWAEPAVVRLDPLTADRMLRSAAQTKVLALRP